MTLFGAIEAGGTKLRCTVGTAPGDLRAEARIETRGPEETLAETVRFFREHGAGVVALGLGCFGPVDLENSSPTYGHITTTPKPGWAHVDVVGALRDGLGLPVGFETDVGAAALGEGRWGAARGLADFAYVTVGTGIGGAVVAGGSVVHGLVHPELGHLLVPRASGDDFAGACPYHGDCLEGMASGVALRARWGVDPTTLAEDHPAWALEAHYLAAGLANLILVASPRRVVLGGGVMERARLLPLVRERVARLLGGYVAARQLGEDIASYLVAPGLGHRSALCGALLLAERTARGPEGA